MTITAQPHNKYRIADAHAHIYPEKIARKATESVGAFYDIQMDVDEGRAGVLLERGSAIGVEKYLVCSVATKVEQVASISNFIAGECALHPEFVGLGAYHQNVTDAAKTLDLTQQLGLVGVKIHPDFQKVNIDDPRMLPLYEELVARDMIILIHMGDDRFDFSAPHRLMNVLERVPNLKCIAAHFGGYRAWDEAAKVLHGTNVYYDTSSSLFKLAPEKAVEMAHHYGIERMMFGVDFPMWDHAEEFARFMALEFTEDERRAILYDNFARVFLGQTSC